MRWIDIRLLNIFMAVTNFGLAMINHSLFNFGVGCFCFGVALLPPVKK